MRGKCGTLSASSRDNLARIKAMLLSGATRSTSVQTHEFETGVDHFSEGKMHSMKRALKLAMAAAAVMGALSVTAQAADCMKVAAVGSNFTHDSAVLFSTNALKNTIAGKGLIAKGPVKTTCDSGSAMIECHSSQMACKGGTPATCLGPWLCF
jgi:hypothetical protein